jgi:hypothetical protein
MAKGFWVSLPMPVDRAAGIRPIAAIRAVITTGRTRDTTPSIMASFKRHMGFQVLAEHGDQYHTILDTYTKQGYKTNTGRYTEVCMGNMQCQNPAYQARTVRS